MYKFIAFALFIGASLGQEFTLVFEDNFDELNLETWQHEITAGGGGSSEFQYYTNNRSNSYVRDGILYIKPTLTADLYGESYLYNGRLNLWGASPADICTSNAWYGCERFGNANEILNPIQSARLRTVFSQTLRYGKIEVRAKMPTGDWLWPAIWMLPQRNPYGGWPASGEIDLVESRGNVNLTDPLGNSVGVDHMGSTMHWGPYYPHNAAPLTTTTRYAENGTFGTHFHVYAMEWNDKYLRFLLDGEEIMFVDPGDGGFWEYGGWHESLPDDDNPWAQGDKLAPFDKPFYITMNVAVGGTTGYWDDNLINSPCPKPWSNTSPYAPKEFWEDNACWYPTWRPDENNGEYAALQVDYVRFYEITQTQ
uniref:Beta-1,3-glucan-binding protein-like n=1 Tax=Saccoglossus kowalevskii TaxID=10224 RepID=A0ABM0GZP8_SACKO|nr:PREDICTED: beta-1,3-glucan-binding protein-like [Saccoglossus kowalevskii]